MYRPTKYYYDTKSFEIINTPEKAYWLGFIFADGNVVYTKSTKNLKLTSKDKEILIKFKKFLKSNNPIKIDKRISIRYYIVISSKKIVKDLMKVGVVPNKRYCLKFPKFLKPNLIKYFIKGYFDGDGWISLQYLKPTYTKIMFGICSASYNFIKKLQDRLCEDLNLNKVKIYYSKSHCYSINYGIKKKMKDLYDYFYSNKCPYLKRKKIKFIKGLKCLK